ncbi:DUF2306 domain-containing protein [Muricauda sp. JGD-17]|uniref:DUF2306 domain-containing protein n=1 Tax=Flagellimonas ochracea TaxID=2696472 RepID=A0A964TBB8_9FLAO|nr:DUF2306 domain-containing protein [Allomuricauda ochracea]NAY91723.1 DUF2306 domain-containing protein [Allomuricauda ochracea]
MKKYLLIGFFFIGAITMLIMSLHFFQHEISGILKYKDISSSALYRLCFKSHILFGIIAIFTGPTQFLTRLRIERLNLHKRLGYVYFFSVLFSSVMGLIAAQFAMGGIVSTIGFSVLSVFWFTSAILAIHTIRKKDIRTHKKWMYVNYGLTFAAITQRTLLLIPLFLDIKFISIYRLSAWAPWILNTMVALYLFKKSEPKVS